MDVKLVALMVEKLVVRLVESWVGLTVEPMVDW